MAPALAVVDRDREGRAGAKIFGDLVKHDTDRQPIIAQHFDPLANLQDNAAIGGEHLRLLSRLRAGGRVLCGQW